MDGSQISPDSGMDFISATGTILYYITLPIVTTFWLVLKLLQVILAPIIGLLKVFIAVALLPIRWIAKFEVRMTAAFSRPSLIDHCVDYNNLCWRCSAHRSNHWDGPASII